MKPETARIVVRALKVTSLATISVAGWTLLSGNEWVHERKVMRLARYVLSPETAHVQAVLVARSGWLPLWGDNFKEYPELETTVWGVAFKNPVGLAAGFDKNADAVTGLRRMGWGFVEVGTVTPLPQHGNPRPRVFRLEADRAVINRYGFNSDGHGKVMTRLMRLADEDAKRRETGAAVARVPLGVNLGKNKATPNELAQLDYSVGITHIGPYCDYVVINVSSPNTPGLRQLQGGAELARLLLYEKDVMSRLEPNRRPKLLIKVSPDLSYEEKRDVAQLCLERSRYGVDGLIVANTTLQRPETLTGEERTQVGGLSGVPLRDKATECVKDFYQLTRGEVPIIGVGGISNGHDAYMKIRAGASLVQLYTALVYQGFPVIGKVKRELAECLRRDGYHTVSEAVGVDSA